MTKEFTGTAQALQWFEDEHSMFCNIVTRTTTNEICESSAKIVSWKFAPIDLGVFETREEARQACLNKLIQIVKDK